MPHHDLASCHKGREGRVQDSVRRRADVAAGVSVVALERAEERPALEPTPVDDAAGIPLDVGTRTGHVSPARAAGRRSTARAGPGPGELASGVIDEVPAVRDRERQGGRKLVLDRVEERRQLTTQCDGAAAVEGAVSGETCQAAPVNSVPPDVCHESGVYQI